jgi:hypothetical protein
MIKAKVSKQITKEKETKVIKHVWFKIFLMNSFFLPLLTNLK